MQFVYNVDLNPIGQILCWVRINPDPTSDTKKEKKKEIMLRKQTNKSLYIYIYIYIILNEFKWIGRFNWTLPGLVVP